ncbi:hypothetical protein D7Y06_20820, partial [Roseburia sp. 1XD42-69]
MEHRTSFSAILLSSQVIISVNGKKSKNKYYSAEKYSTGSGSSTLVRNIKHYKPQKCGLFYVKFYLFLCCMALF